MYDLPNNALVNFIFPNNEEVWWSLMIVIYPYLTGLIAGAFVVSALYHVLNLKQFKPVANFALIAAFCFGLFAGMPLLVHLAQPQRAYEIFVTPHLTSAMSVFGYVYSGYMILLSLEIWLIYRKHFIQKANTTTGIQRRIWHLLTLGVTTYHPDSAQLDHKFARLLAAIGIPWAVLLHGYVGFIFGSVKAISWWATALQPIIFLSSAVVSGIAILILMYTFIHWRRRVSPDYSMIKKLAVILWAAFLFDWGLEMLEVAHVWYQDAHEWSVIMPLILGPLYGSYIWGQIIFLSAVPVILLGYAVFYTGNGRGMLFLVNVGSFLLLTQVLFMRFNVVIGGQLISKSARGFVDFHWDYFGKEGLLVAVILLAAPFITYYVISRFLPIFPNDEKDQS
ncbi:MAG: NrfD/PsrC family molybdoenzyme membrane anchor subunit [Gammaproteobacteria bacterium]